MKLLSTIRPTFDIHPPLQKPGVEKQNDSDAQNNHQHQLHIMSSNDGAKNAAGQAAGAPNDGQDLTVFVQSLLEQMQSRFTQMSEAIIGRIDEMGSRIDDLEKSISDLMDQTNEDGAEKPSETPSAKDKGEAV